MTLFIIVSAVFWFTVGFAFDRLWNHKTLDQRLREAVERERSRYLR